MKRSITIIGGMMLGLSVVAFPGAAANTVIPSAGSTVGTTPTFTWAGVRGATWYRVWANPVGQGANQLLCTDLFYISPKVDPGGCWVQGSTTFIQTQALTPGSWKWWVQPWTSGGSGNWSAGIEFTIAAAPPLANPAWLRVNKAGTIVAQSGGFVVTKVTGGANGPYYAITNPTIPSLGDKVPVVSQEWESTPFTLASMFVYRSGSAGWQVFGATDFITWTDTAFTLSVPTQP